MKEEVSGSSKEMVMLSIALHVHCNSNANTAAHSDATYHDDWFLPVGFP